MILDELETAAVGRSVECLVDDDLDPRPQALHHARSECPAHQRPEPRVVRRVDHQHRDRPGVVRRLEPPPPVALRRESIVAEKQGDVLVSSQHPGVQEQAAVDGVRPPAGRDAKNERINIALLKTWSAPGA